MQTVRNLLILTLILIPSTCFAQDPIILKVDRNPVPPGSALLITGRNFTKDTKKIKVEVGNQPCMVSQSSETQIYVVTNEKAKIGKGKLVVTIGGKKAELPLEVVDPKNYKAPTNDGDGEKAMPNFSKIIVVESLTQATNSNGQRIFRVKGVTQKMADDFKVYIEIKFGPKSIVTGSAKIKGNRFQYDSEAFKGEIFPGAYTVITNFSLRRQSRRLRKKWLKTMDKTDIPNYQNVLRQDFFTIGDKAEGKKKAAELRVKYERLLKTLRKSFDDMQFAYAATARSMFRKGRKIEEKPWQDWVVKQGYVKNKNEPEPELDKLRKKKTYLRGAYLNDSAWTKYVKDICSTVKDVRQKAQKLKSSFKTPRYPDTDYVLEELVGQIASLAYIRTVYLYQRNELKLSNEFKKEVEWGNLPYKTNASGVRIDSLFVKAEAELDPKKFAKDMEKKGDKKGRN